MGTNGTRAFSRMLKKSFFSPVQPRRAWVRESFRPSTGPRLPYSPGGGDRFGVSFEYPAAIAFLRPASSEIG